MEASFTHLKIGRPPRLTELAQVGAERRRGCWLREGSPQGLRKNSERCRSSRPAPCTTSRTRPSSKTSCRS
eukprot:2424359-Prymnesium_polylepis.1